MCKVCWTRHGEIFSFPLSFVSLSFLFLSLGFCSVCVPAHHFHGESFSVFEKRLFDHIGAYQRTLPAPSTFAEGKIERFFPVDSVDRFGRDDAGPDGITPSWPSVFRTEPRGCERRGHVTARHRDRDPRPQRKWNRMEGKRCGTQECRRRRRTNTTGSSQLWFFIGVGFQGQPGGFGRWDWRTVF